MNNQSYTFNIEINDLGAGNMLNINLGGGSSWLLGFEMRSGFGGPLSIADLSLSSGWLAITAGSAPVNASLTMNVVQASPPYLSGTTVTNDPNCHVKAYTSMSSQADMMGNWTILLE